jgi:hypothetical protein
MELDPFIGVCLYDDKLSLQELQLLIEWGKSQKNKRSDAGICELPDEILVDILSRLSMPEAVRTSVLSRRWKPMWTYRSSCLDFDNKFFSFCDDSDADDYIYESKVNRVNQILNAHNGTAIKEFRVQFCLDNRHQSDIDKWINFALHKRVEKLALQLGLMMVDHSDLSDIYSFKLNPNIDVSFLTSLRLDNLYVTGDVIEHILTNCALLEELVVRHSPSLIGVRVVVPCPKLNYLDISYCNSLQYLDIYSAPNLKSVSYIGPENSSLSFMNVPNLSYIDLCVNYMKSLVSRFGQLPLQVEKLRLVVQVVLPQFHILPRLKKVKHLELVLGIKSKQTRSLILPCASIFEACPNMEKLSLEFVSWMGKAWEEDGQELVEQFENRGMHKNLKEIEVTYFRGSKAEIEVFTYLLSSAPFLERILFTYTRDRTRIASQYSEDLAQQLVPAVKVLSRYLKKESSWATFFF